MRLLIFISLFITINHVLGEYEPFETNYHGEIGIPEAARIRAAEAAMGPRIEDIQFPFAAGLIIKLTTGEESMCSASLLSNTKLATAAQCWRTKYHQGEMMTVVLGSNRLFSGGVRINTVDVVVHWSYNMELLRNDVAVVTIDRVDFTDTIKPIPLDDTVNRFYSGMKATVVGFGTVGTANDRNRSKREIEVQIMSKNRCYFVYGYGIVASTRCAEKVAGNISCTGDTGGPLVINNTLAGIISFNGPKGCERGVPVAFSLIMYAGAWIRHFL